LFSVKVKLIESKFSKEPKPAIQFMKPEVAYEVLNVYTWHKTDKETGVVTVYSRFLIGDPETGFIHYVDPQGVVFVGDKND
jgi:hypothetical protein